MKQLLILVSQLLIWHSQINTNMFNDEKNTHTYMCVNNKYTYVIILKYVKSPAIWSCGRIYITWYQQTILLQIYKWGSSRGMVWYTIEYIYESLTQKVL